MTRRHRIGRGKSDSELAALLDRIGNNRGTRFSFSDLMAQVAAVQGSDARWAPEAIRVALRLDRWKRDLTHGS